MSSNAPSVARVVVVVLVGVLLAASCGSGGGNNTGRKSTSGGASVVGTWTLAGSDGTALVTMRADGEFQTADGCNSGGGRWRRFGANLRFTGISMTLKSCPAADPQLYDIVSGTRAWRIDHGRLILSGGKRDLGTFVRSRSTAK